MAEIACCPRCRLVQAPTQRCRECGDERPIALDDPELTKNRIEGITVVPHRPATGWRDTAALLTTALGITVLPVGVGYVLYLLGVSAQVGMIGLASTSLASGWIGYRRQFRRLRLKTRPQLAAAALPARTTSGIRLEGVVVAHERTLTEADATRAVAIAVIVRGSGGVLLRAIEVVPFWLAIGDRRVLVTGECAIDGPAQRIRSSGAHAWRALERFGVTATPLPRDAFAEEIRIVRGARIAVTGVIREQHANVDYRESVVEAMCGDPGAPVWIDA